MYRHRTILSLAVALALSLTYSATGVAAELVKAKDGSGSIESFTKVVEGCSVPVVIAGGPKMDSDKDIFKMVEGALKAGCAGVSIGRNAFQHKTPEKMVAALCKMVHEGASVSDAAKVLQG